MITNNIFKPFIYRLFAVMLLLGVVNISCSDWLYLEPQDTIIVQEFWKSKEEVHSAAMGIYSSMISDHPYLLFRWAEVRAEMVKSDNYSDYTYINNGDILPTLNLMKWAPLYRTINYCNNLLVKAPSVLEVDQSFTEEMLHEYQGEAYAIRALMYFYLARYYGEVPLVLDATLTDDQELRVAKSKQGLIFKQVEQDLAMAENLVAESFPNIESDKGRITKASIHAMQADLYLWTNDFTKSVEAADKVINSGKFGLVPFGDLWLNTLFHETNSIEGIFELQYSSQYLNPFYATFNYDRTFYANADVLENFFPIDIYLPTDSADIRADRGSYRSSRNYKLWKYIGLNRDEEKSEDEATSNFILYRYADVMLLKAEALAMRAEGNDLEESFKIIKQIRARAKASKETQDILEGEILTTRGLISYVVNERAREFMFEGKRWLDVLRNARRNNYERKDLIENMLITSAPYNRLQIVLSKYQDTLSHYYPIPQDDINAGYPVLVQNPFYTN